MQKSQKQAKSSNRRQRRGLPPSISEFKFYEKSVSAVLTNAAGTISTSIAVSTALIAAARLAGLQAIYDEGRVDRVRVTLKPGLGKNVFGRVTLYIERDIADAIAATSEVANANFESQNKSPSSSFRLTWGPQEPADREFQSLTAFTSLGFFGIVGSGLTYGDILNTAVLNATGSYEATVESWWTLRGRP